MNSFLNYVGGKSLLTKKIIPLIPEHHAYCEVFTGASWLLFRKEESEVEIINDINSDLVTLYRVVKLHLEEFIRYLKWLLTARDEFARFKKEAPELLTDIQRAVRFYYLLKNGYGGRLEHPSFSINAMRRSGFNLLRIEEELSAVHLRLCRVYIENKPWQDIITRYDRQGTFFYLDPPYFNYEDYYGKNIFPRSDFSRLADLLTSINGKFLMSINDVPEIRRLFKDFHIREVDTNYMMAGADKKKKVTELIITNYTTSAE